MATSQRPEPGVATDEELREAVAKTREAIPSVYLEEKAGEYAVTAERFSPTRYGDFEWSEVITVKLADTHSTSKTNVINELLTSDAPVVLRDLGRDGNRELTLYPTNQQG
jgi:hypothetical protein